MYTTWPLMIQLATFLFQGILCKPKITNPKMMEMENCQKGVSQSWKKSNVSQNMYILLHQNIPFNQQSWKNWMFEATACSYQLLNSDSGGCRCTWCGVLFFFVKRSHLRSQSRETDGSRDFDLNFFSWNARILMVSGITLTSSDGFLATFTFGGFLYVAFLHGRQLAEGVTSSRAIGGHYLREGWWRCKGDFLYGC